MKHDVMIETEQAAFSLTWQNAGGSNCLRYKDIKSALGPTRPHRFLFSKYLKHICNIFVIIFFYLIIVKHFTEPKFEAQVNFSLGWGHNS